MHRAKKTAILLKYVSNFPRIKRELKYWQTMAEQIPKELKVQAHASLDQKAFHCIGGSIYAMYPGVNRKVMQSAIVSLQTISDYLDNLCDRVKVNDDRAFRQLHFSFLDALTPKGSIQNYYKYYPYQENTYLTSLVKTCQTQISKMPYYHSNTALILRLARYYCELQVRKHLVPNGERLLKEWISETFSTEDIAWNEWAAATGSTLGIFMLFAASFHPYSTSMIKRIYDCYVPGIQALHILLDYYIDVLEDQEHGDINFTYYYDNHRHSVQRLSYFMEDSKKNAVSLPYSYFHTLVIQGLIAMYGSDPKVRRDKLFSAYQQVLANDQGSNTLYQLCCYLRKVKHFY